MILLSMTRNEQPPKFKKNEVFELLFQTGNSLWVFIMETREFMILIFTLVFRSMLLLFFWVYRNLSLTVSCCILPRMFCYVCLLVSAPILLGTVLVPGKYNLLTGLMAFLYRIWEMKG